MTGGSLDQVPCLGHALGRLDQFSITSLQFRTQPPRGRGIAFAQLEPTRRTFVIPVIVRDPAEIFGVFRLTELRLCDNCEPTRAAIHSRLVGFLKGNVTRGSRGENVRRNQPSQQWVLRGGL